MRSALFGLERESQPCFPWKYATNRLQTDLPCVDAAFPEGLRVPSSTVITGQGGAGKPIIALGYVSAWLRQGGAVISAPLQFPDPEFISQNLADLYDVDVRDYEDSLLHVAFDPEIDGLTEQQPKHLRENLVTPEIWDRIVREAGTRIEGGELGTLFFATALNLPLLSSKHRDALIDEFDRIFRSETITSLFCISTSMIEDVASDVAGLSDNLVVADPLDDHESLRFRVERGRDVAVSSADLVAPFPYEQLVSVKDRSDEYRVTPLDQIRDV